MGYGVIGNTAVSGTAILGSSPSTPAKIGLAPGPRPVGLAVMTPPSQGGDRRFESGTGYETVAPRLGAAALLTWSFVDRGPVV